MGRGFQFEIVEAVRRVTGKPIAVVEEPRRPGDPAVLIASSAKITKELGWKPEHDSIDAIVASAWDWQQQRYQRTEL